MPLILKFHPVKDCTVAVWKVTEDPETLLLALHELGIYADIPFFRNRDRLSEWLTARLLLAELGVRQRIRYDEAGKPHLEGDARAHISLSHSAGYVAAIVHKNVNSGIDIEHTGDRILKVQQKFTGPQENEWLRPGQPDYLKGLYQVWGAKECAFKIYGRGGVDFRSQLFVAEPVKGDTDSTVVTLEKDGKTCRYHVFFQYLDEMVLTYGYEA